MIACPRCSLSHKPSVEVCDCGYNLSATRRKIESLSGDPDVRGSAYRWLQVWLSVIKWSALVAGLVGGWFALDAFMNEELLQALVVAALTGLGLISSVAASKGITLLLYLDNQHSAILRDLADLRRQRD